MAKRRKGPRWIAWAALGPTGVNNAALLLELSGVRVQATTTGSASVAATLPVRTGTDTFDVVQITCTQDAYIAFGGNSVSAAADATSMLLTRGSQVILVPVDTNGIPYTHFSVRQVTAGGVLQIEGAT